MKRALVIFLLLVAACASAGCWDTIDISNRAYITAVGIDRAESPSGFKVSLEIVKPAELLANSGEPAAVIHTVEAESIALALEQIQARIPRRLTMGHVRVLLVGEKQAGEDLRDVFEYFEKQPDIAMRLQLMFVQDGEALDILKSKPQMRRYVSQELVAMTQLEYRYALSKTSSLSGFLSELRATGGRGFAGRILSIRDGAVLIRHGGAVFDKWRLVGWLSSSETQSAGWITNGANATVVGDLDGGTYVYRVRRSSGQIKPFTDEKGRLGFIVNIKTDGMIRDELKKDIDLSKPENIRKMEKLFSRVISEQAGAALYKSQKELGVDYLGFGEALRRYDPRTFKKLDWEKAYPDIPVQIKVEARISQFGLST